MQALVLLARGLADDGHLAVVGVDAGNELHEGVVDVVADIVVPLDLVDEVICVSRRVRARAEVACGR